MKVAVMQPYFFPYIGYWQLLNAADIFVIFDDVNFIKKGYINRNSILVGGKPKKISLELLKASQNKLINEIDIGTNKGKLLKTIEMEYKKSPYFEAIFPMLKDTLDQSENNLAKFVGRSLEKISGHLEIDTRIIYSSDIKKNNLLSGQNKIIEIVKILGATNYINAIGGQGLYDREAFKREGIELHFIDTEIVEYKQFDNEFFPCLSIVDVLMFNGLNEIKDMLGRYRLL